MAKSINLTRRAVKEMENNEEKGKEEYM